MKRSALSVLALLFSYSASAEVIHFDIIAHSVRSNGARTQHQTLSKIEKKISVEMKTRQNPTGNHHILARGEWTAQITEGGFPYNLRVVIDKNLDAQRKIYYRVYSWADFAGIPPINITAGHLDTTQLESLTWLAQRGAAKQVSADEYIYPILNLYNFKIVGNR